MCDLLNQSICRLSNFDYIPMVAFFIKLYMRRCGFYRSFIIILDQNFVVETAEAVAVSVLLTTSHKFAGVGVVMTVDLRQISRGHLLLVIAIRVMVLDRSRSGLWLLNRATLQIPLVTIDVRLLFSLE